MSMLEMLAVQVATELGLTMSVQDWLITETGPTFLEVNPQGQWLFLEGSEEMVTPTLCDHLACDPTQIDA